MVHRALLLVVVLQAAACGGSSSPSTPTPAPATAVTTASVAINPATDLVKILGTEAFTATATMSDGSSKSVAGTWATDAPAIATIDSAGKVTGVAPGQAAITVTYDGAKATRTIRVVPDYQGNWTGEYTVLTCQDSGDFSKEDWCKAALEDGVVRVTMALTQTRDVVSGTWTHDVMSGTAQGTIEADGTLPLAGTGTMDRIPMAIAGWRARSTDNKSQAGKFTMNFTSTVWSGSSQAGVQIRICTKVP